MSEYKMPFQRVVWHVISGTVTVFYCQPLNPYRYVSIVDLLSKKPQKQL